MTFQGLDAAGPAWVSDGSALVYSAGGSLWRVAAWGTSQPKKLPFIGQDAYQPVISHRASRLAYTHSTGGSCNIWRVAIPSPKGKENPPTKLIASTRVQGFAQYSPDGTKIAFTSDRSGTPELWVCNADGSNALQFTHFGKALTGDAQWSPDGRRLTFYSYVEGHSEVYVINANGESLRRLTFSSLSENSSWSKDGRWIYFNDLESIKKVSLEGGPVVLVAKNRPGWAPVESPDRKFIYVTGNGTDLWRFPVEGGQPKQVLHSINDFRSYAVVDDGIYFIPRPDPTEGCSIQFLEMATGRVRKVAELGKQRVVFNLAVSPDRHWALYTQQEQGISELMLVENFR
jgi:dipeptidyl aminopeptidase/acylaminoacyl peptidase